MMNLRIAFLCFVSVLLPNVLSAQSCEANLGSSGSKKDGLTITSSVALNGLPPHDAIGRIKEMIAADAAFDVGADTYENGKAALAITQRATSGSREIPMFFTANDQGLITFKAVLPAGMAMKLADAGSYVCGKWLDKLQASSHGEALAVAGQNLSPAPKPSLQPVPVTPTAEITSNCEANFSTKGAMFPGGYQYGSYVSVPISEFDTVFRNLKTAAGPGGYKVAEERQQGDQKQMLLIPTKGGNPIVVILDSHNGHFGIGMQAAQGQPLISDAARGVLCSWVGLGTANPNTLSTALSQQANDSRGAAPGLESRTAAPKQQLNELRPSSVFDLAAAKAALEPGNSTIRGTGCIRRAGNLILAKNQHVYLYPATPYFREAMDLMTKAKPGKDHLDIDPQAISTRMDGMSNLKGQFQFTRMRPGTYYIFTTLESAISGVQDVSSGPVWNGPDELINFHTLVPYTNHYGDILQKYVEIKNDGDAVDITLTSHIKWSTVVIAQSQSHAGLFGCKDGHGIY